METARPPDGRDKRGLPRLRVRMAAKIFPGGADCRITDLTAEGARLTFSGPAPAMDELIVLELDSGRVHQALAAWRRGSELGVRFTGSAHAHGPAPAMFDEARAYWLEREGRRPAVTTFRIEQAKRSWKVKVEGPTLSEPAVVGTFLHRWKAERFAREQVQNLRAKGVLATLAA